MEDYEAPDPDGGPDRLVTNYSYTPDGDLEAVTLPTGETIGYVYRPDGKLETMTIVEGSYQFGYDTKTGLLSGVVGPGGCTLNHTYDGPMPESTTWGGAGCVQGTVGRTYRNDFRLGILFVNGSSLVDYGYNSDGLFIGRILREKTKDYDLLQIANRFVLPSPAFANSQLLQ